MKKYLSIVLIITFSLFILSGCMGGLDEIANDLTKSDMAKVNGQVVDSNSDPINDVVVIVDGKNTYSNQDGMFQLEGIEAGENTIYFSKENYEDLSVDKALFDGDNDLGTISLNQLTDSTTYYGEDYFETEAGFGIKYQVTDSNDNINTEYWAISQDFNENNEYNNNLDFIYSFTEVDTDGHASILGGGLNNMNERNSYSLFVGIPVSNLGNFFRFFSIPAEFQVKDIWETFRENKYTIESIGSHSVNDHDFSNTVKVSFENFDYSNSDYSEYIIGSGYFILAENTGIVELEFKRSAGGTVRFEYINEKQFSPNQISGTVNNLSSYDQLIVSYGNSNSTLSSIIDETNNSFNFRYYGPDLVLRIIPKQNDEILYDSSKEIVINNITSDKLNLNFDFE